MIYLRQKFEEDEVVLLDADFANSSEVKVVNQTPRRLYTTVTGDGKDTWDVMTYRLTKINLLK
jgi:hypothetical protein